MSLKELLKDGSIKEKFALYYLLSSCVAVLFTIATIIATCFVFSSTLIIIYLCTVLAYAISLFVLEIVKLKQK